MGNGRLHPHDRRPDRRARARDLPRHRPEATPVAVTNQEDQRCHRSRSAKRDSAELRMHRHAHVHARSCTLRRGARSSRSTIGWGCPSLTSGGHWSDATRRSRWHEMSQMTHPDGNVHRAVVRDCVAFGSAVSDHGTLGARWRSAIGGPLASPSGTPRAAAAAPGRAVRRRAYRHSGHHRGDQFRATMPPKGQLGSGDLVGHDKRACDSSEGGD